MPRTITGDLSILRAEKLPAFFSKNVCRIGNLAAPFGQFVRSVFVSSEFVSSEFASSEFVSSESTHE